MQVPGKITFFFNLAAILDAILYTISLSNLKAFHKNWTLALCDKCKIRVKLRFMLTLSQRLIGELIGYPCSGVRHRSVRRRQQLGSRIAYALKEPYILVYLFVCYGGERWLLHAYCGMRI